MLQVAVPIAVAVVKIIAPHLKHLLVPVGEAVQEKFTEAVADAGFEKAKQLWEKITSRFKGDEKLQEAATDLATVKERYQETAKDYLVEVLAKKMEASPDLAEELQQMMGGEKKINEIVAGDGALITKIRQTMSGDGTNTVRGGDNSTISNVEQTNTIN